MATKTKVTDEEIPLKLHQTINIDLENKYTNKLHNGKIIDVNLSENYNDHYSGKNWKSSSSLLSSDKDSILNKNISNSSFGGLSKEKVIKKNINDLKELDNMSVISVYDNDYNREMDSTDRPAESPSVIVPIENKNKLINCNTCGLLPPPVRQRSLENDGPDPFDDKSPSILKSLYFEDGIRSIDFVMAWTPTENVQDEAQRIEKRTIFEENLINEGLQLEKVIVDDELHFVKIHTPLEVLRRYAEILKLRMPMKESLCSVHKSKNLSRLSSISNAALYITNKIPGFGDVRRRTTSFYSKIKGRSIKLRKQILIDEKHFPPRSHRFTAVYSRDKEYLFDLSQPCFFTPAIRSRVVKFILDRKRFLIGNTNDYAFGIDRLIADEVYLAAYPLHDGEINIPGSMRNLLYTEWAAVSKWYRYQPLDYIKEYFGVKIGLYFAWLGYYTYMLLLASIVGVACFIYSLFTMNSYQPSKDICSGDLNVKMCPLCDKWCDYWDLNQSCIHVKITYLFDNSTTVFFAIFMSFWATLFLELWKRYSAEITHRWDLTGFDIHEEHPRPEYLARLAHVKKIKIDYVTHTEEPQPPYWRMKLPATVFSFSIVILLVALAFAAVLAVVLYRMSVFAGLRLYGKVTTSDALLFSTATAASINLILIIFFNWIYDYLAVYLTELELLRTQTEFDDSLTLKIYLLQFVNYYASIFYIAFFKGKFIGYPSNYNRFYGYRQEECGLGGCLTELCIQLAIIMVGKQAMNTILEMLLPKFYKWLIKIKVRLLNRKSTKIHQDGKRWWRDLKLIEWGPRSLFSEYLEMVLQYGFVTIFVAAFPLAPFFALLNNIMEMRLDAKKLLTFYRRPVTQRVKNIGVWYRILDSIGKLSVITNGFIIAFTSDFVPRVMYHFSHNGTLNGYLNNSLSYFNTSHLEDKTEPVNLKTPVEFCRYQDYRQPSWGTDKHELTQMYWNILAAKFAFVVIFENIVAVVMIIVRWCIPDMSCELRDQIRREVYITNEIIIKQEAMRARSVCNTKVSEDSDDIDNNTIDVEKLIRASTLSGSQLDLIEHGPDTATGPGHCRPGQYTNVNEAFLVSEGAQIKNRNNTGSASL